MQLDRQQHQIKVHKIHRGNCYIISLRFKHHAEYSTVLLDATPILRKNTLGVVRGLESLIPFTNLMIGHTAGRLFRVSHAGKGTIHLQASMSSAGFEPRSYNTTVSVTSHYT
ncbi:hypothetical protein TNCV_4062251 [Trichonephila clavipes]|nr:hypothetical protein TNCV_4062251 [Trichonephila clavipes]